ncbi:hypothetical protein RAK27_18670 [Carnobacterium maltaromaticum]|uniref:Uncharacterized protein n=1 Tax=Carnobacterium maltaromaticum TaxID=2751 RepID=A0AAW9K1F2_CARML|nr:hypothetical protein [Carnobacterium maltaromaticum]MDZ5760669.1 hypothetical protein [Carnobacterium maltaromaticum]
MEVEANKNYQKFMKKERLTYNERSSIVAFDKKATSFEKGTMRLEAMELVKFQGGMIDQEQMNKFESRLANNESIDDIVSNEYYQMSTMEAPAVSNRPVASIQSSMKPTSGVMKQALRER